MEKQGFDLAMHYFRAFAIFSVISVHMWIVPPLEGHESMSRFLDMLRGVLFHSSTLYFVFISGYLFHFLAQRKFDLRTYYRKKLLNVIVPYVILSVFSQDTPSFGIPIRERCPVSPSWRRDAGNFSKRCCTATWS